MNADRRQFNLGLTTALLGLGARSKVLAQNSGRFARLDWRDEP
jgi:hypothetical protein